MSRNHQTALIKRHTASLDGGSAEHPCPLIYQVQGLQKENWQIFLKPAAAKQNESPREQKKGMCIL